MRVTYLKPYRADKDMFFYHDIRIILQLMFRSSKYTLTKLLVIPNYKDNKTNIHIFKDYEKHCISTIFAKIVIKRFFNKNIG